MSAFGGLFIGTSAIHAAQRGLDVTGQNIANSATPGYTRQRVDLESVGGPGVPAFWSRYDGSGEGVKVTGVSRLTDEFLNARARNENAALGALQEQQKTMAAVERTFAEPGDLGLQKTLSTFWTSWSQTAIGPNGQGGQAARNATFENAVNTAMQLNHMSDMLTTQWHDTTTELAGHVTDINSMADRVAALNEAIRNNNIARVPSNELLDQRDVLIGKLAELTGATVAPAELDKNADFNSQAVDVFIGGRKIVDGISANHVKVVDPNNGTYPAGNTDTSLAGTATEVTIAWADDDAPAGIGQGRVSGQLRSLNETLPKYLVGLDAVAAKLAETVNAQQAAGYTIDGDEGGDLFTAAGGGAITAATITVDRATVKPNSLAISQGQPPDALDGNNAIAMAAHLMAKDGADAQYASDVVGLGVEAAAVNGNVKKQEAVVKQAEDARDNVSGVSLNEEMTNLIQFQHSFSAAARFVTVIDQTLETLINMAR